MPRVEHHSEKQRLASGPVNVSDKAVLIGAGDNDFVITSFNMSPNQENGGARKKIPGELVLYPNPGGDTGFVALGAVFVSGKLVEMWGGNTEGIIRLDGVVCARSSSIPLRSNDEISFDYSDNATGGEVYISNKRTTPFVYSVSDLFSEIGSDKYFSDYRHELYTINIKTPLSRPKFTGLKYVTTGSGLPVGSVSYSVRYTTIAGDATSWSQETPVIPIPRFYSLKTNSYPTNQYHGSQVFGDIANPESFTGIGAELLIRVDNSFDFDFIEVKRVLRDSGSGPKYTPPGEIVFRQEIENGQIGTIKFVDGQDNNIDSIVVSTNSELRLYSEIESAQSLIYQDRRLHLFGVKYASRDISGISLLNSPNGEKAYPWIHNMNFQGHSDPFNAAYFKSYPRGERCSFALVAHDGLGSRSLALKDSSLTNFNFPERRERVSADTLAYCEANGRGTSFTSSMTGVSAVHTHEVFEMQRTVDRYHFDVKNVITNSGDATGSTEYPDPDDAGYKPFRPKYPGDPDVSDHSFRPISTVKGPSGTENYNPSGFRPDYFSLGLGIEGLGNIPSWVKSISVVRTETANRVIAQGLGMYSLYRSNSGTSAPLRKYRNKIWFYSSDISVGAIPQAVIDDIQQNPTAYKVQLVSPLGFFTDVYHANHKNLNPSRDFDMISYARIIYDNLNINPAIATSSYVTWSKWMNSQGSSAYLTSDVYASADKIFDIVDTQSIIEGRGSYFEIEVDGNVYDKEFVNNSDGVDSTAANDFLEPFYIVNIIKDTRVAQENDITEYRPTGTHILMDSVIGISSGGSDQEFELVDERWEDCCTNKYSATFSTDSAYVWIEDESGEMRRWLDVTGKNNAVRASILSAIGISGFYLDGANEVYGIYVHENDNDKQYRIKFSVLNAIYSSDFQIPAAGSRIHVKYDNSKPITVFGGDCFIGESIFSPIDREIQTGGEDPQANDFEFNAPMPFKEWTFAENYIVPKNISSGFLTDNIQNFKDVKLGGVRQWAVMFCSESRAAIPYKNGDIFPSVHYIMRPQRWDNTDMDSNFAEDGEGGRLHAQYRRDYPNEELAWGYGGFKTIESVNGDFSAWLGDRFFSIPDSGYNETLEFSTRDHYSSQRQINRSTSRAIKTFPPLNVKDFDDSFGGITTAFKIQSPDSGFDIFFATKLAIAMVPISKSQISDSSGDSRFFSLSDNIVGKEIWKSTTVGIPEGYIKGLSIWKSKAFFVNEQNAWAFNGSGAPVPIGGRIYPLIKERMGYGNSDRSPRVMSGYFPERGEWWVSFGSVQKGGGGPFVIPVVTAFCNNESASTVYNGWIGDYGYTNFDFLIGAEGKMYGLKNLETWTLFDEASTQINGADVRGYVDIPFSPEMNIDKEFIRIKLASSEKPTILKFYLDNQVVCSLPDSSLKTYGSLFEQDVPRKDALVSPSRNRVQSDLLVVRIEHSTPGDFELESVYLQYKQIL